MRVTRSYPYGQLLGGLQGHIPMNGGSYEGYKVISLWMEGAIRRITRSYPYGWRELYGWLHGHILMDGGNYKEGYKVISLWM